LFLKAFNGGLDQCGILGGSCLISSAYVSYPYSDTSRTYAPNTRIYRYIKSRFPRFLAIVKPRFYTGKFGQCTQVSL
jgi:hypothetical protein